MKKGNKFILSLFLALALFSTIQLVSAALTLDEIIVNISDFFKNNIFGFFGNTNTEVIIGIIVCLIIVAGMYDIIELTSIFYSTWVKLIITIGLGIIGIALGWPREISTFLIKFAASVGVFGITAEIVIGVLIFVGLVVGNSWAAKFAVKRHAQVDRIKAVKAGGEAAAAIAGLRDIEKEFKNKP